MKRTLTTFASVLALAWASDALAQDPASSTGGQVEVDEIVVTAQRRSEPLVDVPISVAVASSEDLERAGGNSLENLTRVTPGVYFQRAVYGLSPTVRGVGSTLSAAGGEQNVGLYIDEVYHPAATANIFDLASVAGVEVLKGPQGTLFGRNATGGAILVRTLDPGFTTEGRFKVGYERFGTLRTSAYLNIPLGDTVAANFAAAYRQSDGYVRDLKTGKLTNDGSDYNLRGKVLFQPNEDFSVVLTAAYYELDDGTGLNTRNLAPAPLIGLLGGGPVAMDRWHSSTNTPQYIRTNGQEYGARVELDLSGGTLASITSYQTNELDTLNEIDLSYINTSVKFVVRSKIFTQEVNYTSMSDGPFNYVAGIYYYHSEGEIPFLSSQVLTPTYTPLYHSESEIDAIAGYADGTYDFGALTLFAGIRYSHEKRSADSAVGTAAPAPFTRFQDATDKQWTPRIGVRYALNDDTNVYASYSKGFKSGVFDVSSATGPDVEPETVDAFEMGIKSATPTLSFNVAAFYYNYENAQANATLQVGNAVQNQLVNVPSAEIYGAEGDINMRLSDSFDFKGSVAYTRARYIDFKNAPGWANLGGLTFVGVPVDASGKTMVRAPEFTASATLTYHRPIGADNELEISISPYYSSRVYFTFDNTLSQPSYATLDANATLTFGDNLKVSIFGRNLTDSDHKIYASQLAMSLEGAKFAEPRTYGVSVGYSF